MLFHFQAQTGPSVDSLRRLLLVSFSPVSQLFHLSSDLSFSTARNLAVMLVDFQSFATIDKQADDLVCMELYRSKNRV
jgi:hypothetical protein